MRLVYFLLPVACFLQATGQKVDEVRSAIEEITKVDEPALIPPPLKIPEALLSDDGLIPPIDDLSPPDFSTGGAGIFNPAETHSTLPSHLVIKNSGSIESILSEGERQVHYRGNIRLTGNNGLQIFSNEAIWSESKKTITLRGNVSVYHAGLVQRGDVAIYHYEEERVDVKKLRAALDPILIEAGQFESKDYKGRTIYVGHNAGVTTHDVEKPNYWLRAAKTTIIPDERVIFRDLKFYAGDTPIFWLPYFSQPMDPDLGWRFLPGARSSLGFFLKNRYGVLLGGDRDPVTGINENAWLLSHWHADLYSRRGLGLGLDLYDTRSPYHPNLNWLKFFYINDLDPGFNRTSIPRGFVNEDRWRLEIKHRQSLFQTEFAQYSLDTNLSALSDQFFLEDYDRQQFRTDPNPDNTISLVRRSQNSLATLLFRGQINDFYQADTRLPEFSFDWVNQPLFDTPLLYESQTSLGFYREHLADDLENSLRDEASGLLGGNLRLSEINQLLDDRGFARFHTYHQATLPLKYDWLNVVPRVGLGYTSYQAVQGVNSATDRSLLSAGVDASFKLTKRYPHWNSPEWGIDGMLHIVQPYATLSWLATDELDPSFTRIDRLTASSRPRPLDVGRFTATDDLANWSIARLGFRNQLLTKRDHTTHRWLTMDTYIDAFIDDPEFDRQFSNLYNDIRWRPLPWLELDLETQFPLFSGGSGFTEVVAGSRFMPHENLDIFLRYRHLNDHPILEDSNRLALETYYRINERWGVGSQHLIEMETGVLELQEYNIHYNTDSWTTSAGLYHREFGGRDEYGFQIGFSLQEFPSASLPIKFGAN